MYYTVHVETSKFEVANKILLYVAQGHPEAKRSDGYV